MDYQVEPSGQFCGASVMKERVVRAFVEVREGCSTDVIIADPEKNQKFIAACRRLGVTSDTAEINRLLYNLRKQKGLEDHPTTHRITCKNQDEYRFASEI